MKTNILKIAVLFVLCIVATATVSAEPTPRWVEKGVKELDKKRTNDTYSFHVFHTYDADRSISLNQFRPLFQYVGETYGVSQRSISLDSIPATATEPTTYTLTFDRNGEPTTVYAQLVDSYEKFDDYADGFYEFNYWMLYAISEPNVVPQFDEFTLTRRYNAAPTAMSLIPGVGQIYKGQKTKGYVIMGTEVVLIGGIIYSFLEYNHFKDVANDHPGVKPSYDSKATTYKQLGIFCAAAAGGLYLYNLLDAAICPGARRVEIHRKNAPSMEMSFAPFVAPDLSGNGMGLGMGVSLKF